MKKALLALLTICCLITFSCKKEEVQPACTEGTVRFTCTSANPYSLKIDGVFQKQFAGGEFKDFTVKEGSHTFEATQVSGYLLYPTVKTEKVAVFGCKTISWLFP